MYRVRESNPMFPDQARLPLDLTNFTFTECIDNRRITEA